MATKQKLTEDELRARFDEEMGMLGEGWDEVDAVMKERYAEFLKLEPGERVQLSIVGKPTAREKPGFKPTDEPTTKVTIPVFLVKTGEKKKWEMSKGTWERLNHLRQKRASEFPDSVFELSRKGSGIKTEYMLDYERQLTEEEKQVRLSLLQTSEATA